MSHDTYPDHVMPLDIENLREPIPLGCVIGGPFWRYPRADLTTRYPIVRSSEGRTRLPLHVWQVVYRRDVSGWCQICGWGLSGFGRDELQIDHVIPWSAGGSDRTDNLRLVHAECNQTRSNFMHQNDSPQMPIAHHCRACYEAWLEVRAETDVPTDTVWCNNCLRVYFGKQSWVI